MPTRFKSFFYGLWIYCFCITPLLSAQSSESITKLDKQNISDFIIKTTDISAGQSTQDQEEIMKYLEKHIETDAHFKTTMKYEIPGYPAQATVMKFTKYEFIAQIMQGIEKIDNYNTNIKIKDIRISKDKTKATVKTRSREKAHMHIQSEGINDNAAIEGISDCTQIIRLNKEGIIRMFNASCTTNIGFMPN